ADKSSMYRVTLLSRLTFLANSSNSSERTIAYFAPRGPAFADVHNLREALVWAARHRVAVSSKSSVRPVSGLADGDVATAHSRNTGSPTREARNGPFDRTPRRAAPAPGRRLPWSEDPRKYGAIREGR